MSRRSDEICDRLFQVRNSMDKQVRQLQDVQKILFVMGAGLKYLQEDNHDYGESAVRIMYQYLSVLERDMLDNMDQMSLIEKMEGGREEPDREELDSDRLSEFSQEHKK